MHRKCVEERVYFVRFQIVHSTVYFIVQQSFFTITSLPWLLFSVFVIDARFGFSVEAGIHTP